MGGVRGTFGAQWTITSSIVLAGWLGSEQFDTASGENLTHGRGTKTRTLASA